MRKIRNRLTFLAGAGAAAALAVTLISRQQARIDFSGRVVVITGGSRGLGLVIARQLAQQGAILVLLARDQDTLERAGGELRAAGAEVLLLPCDVRDQSQVEQALSQAANQFGRIDVLVNNAGIIQVGPVEHMNLADFEDAMAVHFWGPLYAILAALPYMRQQGSGRVVNVSSIGGEVAVPHLAPYTASKYALVGLSDVLRAELAKDGIYVTTVIPGLMRTGSHVNALFKGNHRQEYTWFSVLDAFPLASTDARVAARQIIEAARYGKSHQTITLQARLLALVNANFPRLTALVMKITNRLLPRFNETQGYVARTGWESQTPLSPSILTVSIDVAAERNNQLGGHDPIV